MNRQRFAAVLALAAAAGGAAALKADPYTDLYGDCGHFTNVAIYGKDNREEFCAQDMVIRDLADSTAGLFTDNTAVKLGSEPYVFGTATLGKRARLAPGQRFADQPAAAFCTGFLVGGDLLVTAGHCVMDHAAGDAAAPKDHRKSCQENLGEGDYCENIRVVFGFRKDLGGVIPLSVPASEVYKCASVVSHSLASGPDYTVIKLDRPVAGHRPLAIDRGNAGLAKDAKLFVIGHPTGIPLKIAGDAKVVSTSVNNYSFLTNLDTFQGNSGSPVFDQNTLLVEGILVSGQRDYEPDPDQPGRRVSVYPQDTDGGNGETCTRISVPAGYIPVTGRERGMLEMNKKAKDRLYPEMRKSLERRVQDKRQGEVRPMPIPNYVAPEKAKEQQWL